MPASRMLPLNESYLPIVDGLFQPGSQNSIQVVEALVSSAGKIARGKCLLSGEKVNRHL